MADVCGSRSIWRAAHAGFVGKKPALDADNNGASGHAASHGFKIKGILENHAKDLRQLPDMQNHGNDANQDIKNSHDRHNHGSDKSNPVHAAPDNSRGGSSQDNSKNQRIRECVAELRENYRL